MELATITAAMTGIKVAAEIASTLRKGTLELEKAELKLNLAEIIGSLADAKIAIVEIQEALNENEQEIIRLHDAIKIKGEVKRYGDAYYKKNTDGAPIGRPYCLHCFEKEGSLFSLIDVAVSPNRMCPQCDTHVDKRTSNTLE